jgi:hypothetical protein
VLDDISFFESAKSDITGSTENERFYSKWEKIIKSGMEEDLTRLNPMAHWMVPKDDYGLMMVARLKRELGSIGNHLPRRDE